MSSFYNLFFSEPMAERQRIAEAAGLSLAYIHKHTYVQQRAPRFHFHNAVGLDRASNGKLCMLDTTEGDIDWSYVLERLKVLQRAGRVGRTRIRSVPTAQFEAFWRAYPRKVDKAGTLRSWNTQGCDSVADAIMTHLKAELATDGWQKEGGKYIPHPKTYLNQRRWEASLELPAAVEGVFAGMV